MEEPKSDVGSEWGLGHGVEAFLKKVSDVLLSLCKIKYSEQCLLYSEEINQFYISSSHSSWIQNNTNFLNPNVCLLIT